MKKRTILLIMVFALISICGIALASDDYPYKNACAGCHTTNQGYDHNDFSEWNFFYRQCTDFCAWRLNHNNGVSFTNWYGGVQWGNAKNWKAAAESLGITCNGTPAVGAIACWTGGTWGHVAWVQSISGSNVYVEEYNYNYASAYGTRNIASNPPTCYIHIKDLGNTPDPNPTITFSDDGKMYFMSKTTAQFGYVYVYSTGSIYDITTTGCELADAKGKLLADHQEAPYVKDGHLLHYFRINGDPNESDICYTLSPRTTYKFRSYVICGGKRYYSDWRTFTTDYDKVTMNVDFLVDGKSKTTIDGIGTIQVKIDGEVWDYKGTTNYTDFSRADAPLGASYQVTAKVISKYELKGVASGSKPMKGTLTAGTNTVTLVINTKEPIVVYVNETTFPDSAFRDYVSSKIDKNKDGGLTASEIAAVKSIDLSAVKTVSDLKGIEWFTALQTLNVDNNQLYELDVSKNTKLQTLLCSNNHLVKLDLSKNTKLDKLTCKGNERTVKAVGGRFDVSTIGLVPGKMSHVSGGELKDGTLVMLKPGKASYTYDCGNGYEATFTLNVVATNRVAISSATATIKTYVYTGQAIEAPMTVKAKVNGVTVTLDKSQYTLAYSNNINAGTAKVTVTGTGFFDGTLDRTFKITKVALASAKLQYTKTAFTGSALKPTVTVKASVNGKTRTLTQGTDYTVTYKNNLNPGTATVTIKGKGNFKGTLTKTFKITLAAKIPVKSVTVVNPSLPYTGKKHNPILVVKATVNGRDVSLKLNRDYTVTYTNNIEPGTANVTVKGKGNYTGTVKTTFKINRLKMTAATVTLEKTVMTYTGKALKPKVTVKAKIDGKLVTLVKGTDYTVKYKNNVKTGTASVVITGKGHFTGSQTVTFTIKKK